jgi:hypothetical protein
LYEAIINATILALVLRSDDLIERKYVK